MEVTLNKTFIRLGDVTQSNNNTRNTPDHVFGNDNLTNPRGQFKVLDFPIMSGRELIDLNKKLKNNEFMSFLVILTKNLIASHLL